MTPLEPMHPRSLHIDLLSAAIRTRNQSDGVPSIGEASAELERCRRQMVNNDQPRQGPGWSTEAIADQVAYDVALVRCAQSLEIDCDPDRFGWPEDERQPLERIFSSRVLPLVQLKSGGEGLRTRGVGTTRLG